MKKVITYGTYDLLHQGHINLLRRAKALGDYLIVGVTTDQFDLGRGKLNVRDNVMERIENVRKTGLVDKIIIEEYVGQKIDDIQKYGVDIFAIGSDWKGKFDYLSEYCKVVYLNRTEGISSTLLRNNKKSEIKLGVIGCGSIANRFIPETRYVNGILVSCVLHPDLEIAKKFANDFCIESFTNDFSLFLNDIDAAYIASPHLSHYEYIKQLLLAGKHVLCETPMVLKTEEAQEVFVLAKQKSLTLIEANKTAYCPAFNHLINLVKSGLIGDVVDIDASLSTLVEMSSRELDSLQAGGSVTENASFALLPIFKFLGTEPENIMFFSSIKNGVDIYTKAHLTYKNAIASFKLGLGVKTEGNLVISGTKGYVYVPAPWWKTDYFELRYENQNQNRKYFYLYEGAGLRYELREFLACIHNHQVSSHKLKDSESIAMASVIEKFLRRENMCEIQLLK